MEYAPNVDLNQNMNTKPPLDILHKQLDEKPPQMLFDSPLKRAEQPTAISGEEVEQAREAAQKAEELERKAEDGNSIPIKIVQAEAMKQEVTYEALQSLRNQYSDELIKYLKSRRNKRAVYRRIMTDLKADKHMPFDDEPIELKTARRVYIELLNKKCEEMNSNSKRGISEVVAFVAEQREELLESISEAFSEREVGIASKASGLWDNPEWDESVMAGQLASGKLDKFEKSIPPGALKFDGFRAPAVTESVESEGETVSETVAQEPAPEKKSMSQAVRDFFGDIGKEKEVVEDDKVEPVEEPVAQLKTETISNPETVVEGDFKDKKWQLVRKGADLKVLFDGLEIGGGFVSNGRASLKINDGITVPFYLLATPTQTLQQEAFKQAADKVKSMQLN